MQCPQWCDPFTVGLWYDSMHERNCVCDTILTISVIIHHDSLHTSPFIYERTLTHFTVIGNGCHAFQLLCEDIHTIA